MSIAGLRAATELAATTSTILDRLEPADWAADSACRGWRVQDLVGHLGLFFNFIADPELVFPDNPSGTSERLNDAAVVERADWSTAQVHDYYLAQSAAGLATLEALQSPELRDQPIEMLDLGTYRLSQLADAVAFDHLVHLQSDLLAPHGPVTLAVDLPVAAAIDPAIDWMMAGLPPMCGSSIRAALTGPVGIHLTGATERAFQVSASADVADGVAVDEVSVEDLPANTVHSDALAFTSWATRRSAWRSAAQVHGDPAAVAAVLDALDIV
ncbi:maleylpyruvate isomerase N-terminal domain-containing protein [Gordonia alkaliphila]|uniref:maleylpyruvate isomerase N-terminal domain-containing protein n=1 Tax=Gordonia alkaliphila TaxID=1053547 RepID=UPI001FF2F271|nr:maleylpyruvate isomerase N-terminal domain-containing protein [Gordonia alkaliphila]MCK0439427.1 maleylpyruvate isomerase N-terminal domain-containing protein [Gordonia alkaliphila]